MQATNLLPLTKINKKDVSLVGGKGASLGEMINAGIPVPPGFVITTDLYKNFRDLEIPLEIQKEILSAFDSLGVQMVAVRSSAIAEDSGDASWAGQLESYLNVSRNDLINKIKECWKSIESERAIQYALEQNLSQDQLLVGVIVQAMIASEASGIMFTVNPITKNANEIMIETGFGLGEMIVQGLITPNNFILNKKTLEIKSRNIQAQDKMLVFQDGKNKEVPVPENKKNEQAISDEKAKELAEISSKIETHYGKPQDIEWGIDSESKIWILQSRPITTL